jgi:hypothetical protein
VEEGDADNMWMKMATCIRKVALEEFGDSRGSRREAKDIWGWNEMMMSKRLLRRRRIILDAYT